MKYRILLLAALVCAILAAAVGGTLAGYTTETSYSISIQPAVTNTPKPHKTMKPMADIQSAEDTVQEEQAEPQASPETSDSAAAETDKTADDAPLRTTSDKEA